MRLIKISLSDFKGVDAEFEFAPVVVLFGPNDAGKTNLLEAFELALGSGEPMVRRDPARMRGEMVDDWVEATATVELEGLDSPGSADREFLRSGLLAHFSWPQDELPEGEEDMGWSIARQDEDVADDEDLDNLDSVYTPIFREMLQWSEERCSNWEAVADDYEAVLEAAFKSERFRFNFEGGEWLLPDSSRWSGDLRQACKRLARRRDLWESGRVPFVDPLLDRKTPADSCGLLRFGTDMTGNVSSLLSGHAAFVRATTASDTPAFLSDIEQFIEKNYSFWQEVTGPVTDVRTGESRMGTRRLKLRGASTEGWLKRGDGSDVVNSMVREGCSKLAREAMRIAPRFVSERYEIVIRPLLGSERADFDGRKLQVALRSLAAGERLFDLTTTSSGVRTWAQYSIREAMRTLGEATETPGETRPTIYVLDEPEQHLHPAAQEEVAQWISERVEAGANAIIATHALPFLDLPYAGTEYYRVFRDTEGLTSAARLTADPIGRLDGFVKEAGLSSRAQLIQLTRAVLVVEGEHDRLVVDHYFGKELRASRVRILPLRGAKNASAIAGMEFFRDLDVPLFLLFDNVTARALDNPKELRSDSLEEREIKILLAEWPEGRTPPTVLPLDAPDIICVLPAEAMQAVMRRGNQKASFESWKPLIVEYRALPASDRHDFKAFAERKTGLPFDSSRTIRQILAQSPPAHAPTMPLYQPMQRLLASIG